MLGLECGQQLTPPRQYVFVCKGYRASIAENKPTRIFSQELTVLGAGKSRNYRTRYVMAREVVTRKIIAYLKRNRIHFIAINTDRYDTIQKIDVRFSDPA